MSDAIRELENDHQRMRRDALLRQVLYELEYTVLLRREFPGSTDVRPVFTEGSAHVIAPLVEAVDILESILWASDGCQGHRGCMHSMEPWKRARALLARKWQAYEDREPWPSSKGAPAEKEDTPNSK